MHAIDITVNSLGVTVIIDWSQIRRLMMTPITSPAQTVGLWGLLHMCLLTHPSPVSIDTPFTHTFLLLVFTAHPERRPCERKNVCCTYLGESPTRRKSYKGTWRKSYFERTLEKVLLGESPTRVLGESPINSCYRSCSLHHSSTVTNVVWQVLSLHER